MSSAERHPRILIVRTSAIGDVVHGLPVLNALRDALPEAFLAWVVEPRAADLLRSHRALDKLVVIPRRWLKSLATTLEVRRQLRALEVDMTLDLQGLSKSSIAAWLSGARRRVGFGGKDGREISPWLNNELVVAHKTHVIDRNLELLVPLGIVNPPARFDLEESPSSALAADRILQSLGLADGFALVNPGAGWASKLWPAERYGRVSHCLGQTRALRSLVLWSDDQERSWAEEIVAGSGGFALLAPFTNLLELAALARRARVFIGSDTGPLHLAAGVGTPCVGLYGPMPAERNGPYGAQHIAIQKIRLPGTRRQRRTAGPQSMLAISVEDVAAACLRILDRGHVARRSA